MELNAIEVAIIENVVANAQDVQMQRLDDLSLVLLGGGVGDTIAY